LFIEPILVTTIGLVTHRDTGALPKYRAFRVHRPFQTLVDALESSSSILEKEIGDVV
jgi:hypothetical protein